jgi:hypothetical protein
VPQQLDRPAKVADGRVCLPQVKGGFYLQSAVAERGRELEGLPARRHGAVGVSRLPEYLGHSGKHLYQPGPVVERPGQGLGLTQQGEAPPILSQLVQREIHREAEVDGPRPGVAVLV